MKKILPKEIFQIIDETLLSYDNKLSISLLCNIAGVSRAGYYHWKSNEELRYYKEIKDQEDFSIILEAYNYRGYDKGVRGIYMRLIKINKSMNQKKIRRLMRKFNLNCPIRKANPYRRMAKAIKTNNYASNLLNRQFEAYGPRMVLLTDISYIPYNGVFAYLSVIIDAFTKEVLSYQLSDS
ncbi:MAG: IS3 family transposase, partial [Candidatus Izemoplasmatales bacterium]